MLEMLKARHAVRLHAPGWAAEAIATYGEEAEAIMTAMEPFHGRAERYAFRQVRKAIARFRANEAPVRFS